MTTCLAPSTEDVARYNSLRTGQRLLNNLLIKAIPKDALDEIGTALGIRRKGVLCFESEAEMAILAESCLFDWLDGGRSVIQRFSDESRSELGADDRALLDMMGRARFAILVVEAVEPGKGVWAIDLVQSEQVFVIDMGLSETASEGVLLACRLLPMGDYWMTTGATAPVGQSPSKEVIEEFSASLPREALLTPAGRLGILRGCLARHGEDRSIHEALIEDRPRPVVCAPSPGRNQPCPCNSGKKYKRCCGSAT